MEQKMQKRHADPIASGDWSGGRGRAERQRSRRRAAHTASRRSVFQTTAQYISIISIIGIIINNTNNNNNNNNNVTESSAINHPMRPKSSLLNTMMTNNPRTTLLQQLYSNIIAHATSSTCVAKH